VPVALLLVDVLTTFQFPDGKEILQGALRMRGTLVRLKARTREAGIPALYVNDNFGDWRSEKEVLMGRCLEAKGGEFVRPQLPDSEDYFVPETNAFRVLHDPVRGSAAASPGGDTDPDRTDLGQLHHRHGA
jgi:nicotinamidase-related amidase